MCSQLTKVDMGLEGLQYDAIVCGSEHSFALTTDGELFSWGLNFKGQLGVGDFENRAQPTLVDSFTSPEQGGNSS